MTTTTIKLRSDVRDRLKAQANAANRTLGEHVAHLADLADRETRLASLRAAIGRTPEALLESYRAETDEWSSIDR